MPQMTHAEFLYTLKAQLVQVYTYAANTSERVTNCSTIIPTIVVYGDCRSSLACTNCCTAHASHTKPHRARQTIENDFVGGTRGLYKESRWMISVHHLSLPRTFPSQRTIKAYDRAFVKRMDHSIESIYFDLLEREMNDRQPMSLWGPGHAIYKPVTTSAQVKINTEE